MAKKTSNTAAQQRKRPKKPRQSSSVPRVPRMDQYTKEYIKLLLNPCSGKLVHAPMSGTSAPGYLARNYRRLTLHLTAGANSGYLAWFPQYHTGGKESTFAGGNLYVYESSSATVSPTNTAAAPWGSGTSASGTGGTFIDPSYNFASSTTVASARTIAACAQIMYTGATSNTAGIVGVSSGITPQQLLTANGGGPMTVEQALSLCPGVSRTPLTAREARWMPDDQVPQMRPPLGVTVPASASSPYDIGVPGTNATSLTPVAQATGILIAWTGLPTTTSNDFMIELYKVIEWQPDAVGLVQPTVAPTPSWSFADIARTVLNYVPTFYDAIVGGDYERIINRVMGGQGQLVS